MTHGKWPIDVEAYSAPHVLEDDRYLAPLTRRLYRAGYTTIGKVARLGETNLRHEFGASAAIIERVKVQLDRFDVSLRP